METSAMVLCTFVLAMVISSVSSIIGLTPMEKMNAEILSDYMDLQRKVMKFKMMQTTLGQKGGNNILPPGLQNLLNPLNGMAPPVNGGPQIGNIMPQVAPTNIGNNNLQPATQTVKAKTTTKKSSSKPKSGKVQSPTNIAGKKSMTSSSKPAPGVDMMGNVPSVVGSTLEQNPMMGLDMAAMMNAASMMNTAGGSMLNQGPITNPSNPTLKGVPQMTSSFMNNGQAGMANLGLMLMQQDACSETPSKLRKICMTSKDCSHIMQCVTGMCCAKNLGHADQLDNMLELMERRQSLQAMMAL